MAAKKPATKKSSAAANGADPEAVAAADEQFWDLAGPLLARDDTEEGTIMSSRCLRVDGDFVAMVARSGQLVVKLPKDRVAELIDQGVGEPFAPAGKVFKEWLGVIGTNDEQWESLLTESHTFVKG